MTDIQLLVLAFSVVIPLSLLLYSNSRITEAKETIRAEIRTETAELRAEMRAGFERLELLLKMHEAEHHNDRA